MDGFHSGMAEVIAASETMVKSGASPEKPKFSRRSPEQRAKDAKKYKFIEGMLLKNPSLSREKCATTVHRRFGEGVSAEKFGEIKRGLLERGAISKPTKVRSTEHSPRIQELDLATLFEMLGPRLQADGCTALSWDGVTFTVTKVTTQNY